MLVRETVRVAGQAPALEEIADSARLTVLARRRPQLRLVVGPVVQHGGGRQLARDPAHDIDEGSIKG